MPQSLSKLYVHLAFSTKHREPLLLAPLGAQMHAYLATVLNNQDSPAIEVGGTSDHVHTLFRLSKNSSLAGIVEEIKTSSSKWIKTQGRALASFHWQSGYGGFSVSPGDVEKVAEYIAHQETHHRAVTFQEEYGGYWRATALNLMSAMSGTERALRISSLQGSWSELALR
jgi:REP element-mobilizing transposase RayT